jgi:hypothetical protein
MDGIMNKILKRRLIETERDEDAKSNGELGSEISFWINPTRETLDDNTDDETDDEHAGIMRTGATTDSQNGDNMSLDRSTINTVANDDNDSIQSDDGHSVKLPKNRKEKIMIANIVALREREQINKKRTMICSTKLQNYESIKN